VTQRPRLVVGMSGSSAPRYGIALLETSHALGSVETHLVLSDGARRTIQLEADLDPELVGRLADVVHHPNNLAASISSGSFLFDGPLAGAHLPLHVRCELCGRLPGELLHRRRVRQV
jgi:3-polyprenyl-4-hydroxybenzoate decarboxylase